MNTETKTVRIPLKGVLYKAKKEARSIYDPNIVLLVKGKKYSVISCIPSEGNPDKISINVNCEPGSLGGYGLDETTFWEYFEYESEWVPKKAEKIRVRNHDAHGWKEMYFLFKSSSGYCCVDEVEFNYYLGGDRFMVTPWRFAEPIPEEVWVTSGDLIAAWAEVTGKDPKTVRVKL